MPPIASRSMRKIRTTEFTATGMSSTIPGVHAGLNADTGDFQRVPLDGAMAAVVMFIGIGADNSEFSVEIFAEYPIVGADGRPTNESVTVLLATCANVILGATVGAGSVATSSHRFADTITTLTNATHLTAAETAFSEGACTKSSPGSDGVAALFIPCLARATALIFDFDRDVAATDPTSVNALVSLSPI